MFGFTFHPDMLIITPAIGITHGECEDPHCDESHWRFSLSWVVWTVDYVTSSHPVLPPED